MRAQCWAQAVLVVLLFALFVLAVETVHRSPDLLSLLGAEQNKDRGGPFAEYLHLDSQAIEFRLPGHRVNAHFAVSNRGREGLKNIRIVCAVHDGQGNSLGSYQWTGFAAVPAGGNHVYTFEERRYVSQRALLDQADCRIVGARKAGRPFFLTGHAGRQTDDGRATDRGHGGEAAH
jgi:hypothetical protein